MVGGETVIQLKGWESIETCRGQFFDLMIIDEVAMVRNFFLVWEEILRPTLTDTRGEAIFISTPKGFNHFYDLYCLENDKEKGADYKSFHFTSYDNPFLPKEELEKAMKELTEDRFAQEYLADFRKTQGLVYKEFNRKFHLVESLPSISYEKILGIDFGWTNPTAILLIKKDFDNNYWIAEESYKTQMTNEQIVNAANRYEPNRVYADPEAPEKIEELTKGGLNCLEVIKGKDSIVNGINKVREMFKQKRLRIAKSCRNLIWELETYHYPETKDQRNPTELPEKENDHALDALRYVIMSEEILGGKIYTSPSTYEDIHSAI